MNRFVIETTYHLPVYRQRRYVTASIEEACRLAVADEGWDDEETDIDTSGETFVTGIWEDAEHAYEGKARMIPHEFQETIQRKADLYDRLVALLREPAQPMGLSQSAFERWLPKATAALAVADAIDGGIRSELQSPGTG